MATNGLYRTGAVCGRGLYCSRSGTDIRWFESRATTAGSPQHVCALGADGTGFYRLYTAFRFANAGVNSLNRIGESALSNEIAAGSLFFAVAGFYWLLAVLDKMPAALGKIWLVVAMVLGVIFVYAMCRVYSINTVPTWDSIYTPLGFVLTTLIGGPLLGYLLLQLADVNGRAMLQLPMISVLALIISVASVIMQAASLPLIYSSVQQASALIPDYGSLMVWRLVLLVLGLGCWICPLIRGRRPMTLVMVLGTLLVIAGELIGRGVFYGLHMTVGMAVGG